MWYYKLTESSADHRLYTVMFEEHDGDVVTDSDHNDREEAARRVHWLNGGAHVAPTDETAAGKITIALEALGKCKRHFELHWTRPEQARIYVDILRAINKIKNL